ncbi:glycerate kinase [Leptolyngbya sp. NK1-12]|uniref:glycerate kinase n=1 Tax=Leptolyngbya sp. NK1-12 TaxID=2547451 RepID=UPI00292FD2BF|nr:glycerate kinase [Leptolyngbya sp. NK1-12]
MSAHRIHFGPLAAVLPKLTLGAGVPLTSQDRFHLRASLLDSWQAAAFTITNDTVEAALEQRIEDWRLVYPAVAQFCQQLGWPQCPLEVLWLLWLPLAEQIIQWRRSLSRPLVQGILGVQGTGKTTLTRILAVILGQLGWQVCGLSIDDLYKTYAERQQLQQADPRFRWRGPPGTHDLELGMKVLSQLRQAQFPVALPRFDKSAYSGAGERTAPELVTAADVVLFEGWFVGVRPIDPQQLTTAPAPITTEADRAFAREVNSRLQDYLPLWQQLDQLIVLYPADYRFSQQWRQQAEQQMQASGKTGMSATEINQFVTYFWRSLHPDLFIRPLLQDPDWVDLVIELDREHRPTAIYQPASLL